MADRDPGSAVGERGLFLWVSVDDPNAPPSLRLPVTICPRCGALVPVDSAAPHAGWHARREDTEP